LIDTIKDEVAKICTINEVARNNQALIHTQTFTNSTANNATYGLNNYIFTDNVVNAAQGLQGGGSNDYVLTNNTSNTA